ncbi:endonuclease VII domain-containing protein [Pseudonocardia sp. KRD-184]|uniref:Endonuclease VII domain-containing protein n=1 Tax=Pseudonocardia oceani TaxID=2792013 RepID=A0ABS6UG43_9PSEU|nr:endonuclease VII domain-containing protein [Pseudonocardia oceani]MBW0088247.1 endonuclease VII domain-containing protein [Pseudonocardia oceani]MBW0095029.1 endonuclease VII domain-containing protein [Pseudonocardia oceani]MBW0121118.1 endonuclease VII domain-containing protein [Pseudonocardia oceani]MBW0131196.1 endonuclease VII domain-containing protein [Pseudonocardia oceani]MBW0132637.1 endonuclease VII domain-containing protein [Pseudonocardia oceani]
MPQRPSYYRRGRRPVYCSDACRPEASPPPPAVTEREYEAMLIAQGGRCAICEQPEIARGKSGAPKRLAIDHCHSTGALRGLLCQGCNTGIGLLADDVDRLINAVLYLQRWKGEGH